MNLRLKIVSALSAILLLTLFLPVKHAGVTPVSAGGYCDWVQFVADVTVPDGWPVSPGQVLNKTWRLRNIGTCWWSKSYKLVFVSGAQMGGVSEMNLPKDVAPNQTIDLTIGLTSPVAPGRYFGYWKLQNPAGGLFGIGQTASQPFFVEIEVVNKAAPVFDFAAQAPFAIWGTEASGRRPFPGFYGDPDGFVQTVDRPVLETGIPTNGAGILMSPPAEYNEYIYGIFPAYEIKQGDRFQSLIGCEYGSVNCEVKFALQYQNPEGGSTRSYWNKVKLYKNSFTWVDISLTPLAGKKVSFILTVRPLGTTTSDKAMWINPVIVNSNSPAPTVPTVMPNPVTAVPTISTLPPSTLCDRGWFLADVTVPDGTVFTPGQAFTKTWRLRNVGDCTWTTEYALVFSTGDQMGGPSSINLPASVPPRQSIDLSVNLTAPTNPGSYRGYWLLKNASGKLFGIGSLGNSVANKPFWLAINVAGTLPPSSASGYDFVAHVCEAQWTSGAGVLPCPDQSVTNGTIITVNNPILENNTVASGSALLTVPQNAYNGYIQGVFPPFTVQNGDRFRSIINCEYGQRNCYVVYRLDYQVDNGPIKNFWAFGERHEGLYYQADVDLSPLAGQNVKFILRAEANGSPSGDRALWVSPSIVRSGAVIPPAPTVTATATATATPLPASIPASTSTSTPVPAVPTLTSTPTPVPTFTATFTPVPVSTGRLTYANAKYGFQFTYPSSGVLINSQDNYARLALPPVTFGTNLSEKYLDVTIFENVSSCSSPLAKGYAPGSFESVPTTINGISFVRESGQDSGPVHMYDWVAYSTTRGTACVSLSFVLHSTNPFNYPVPPPVFDKAAESAVFSDIASTFNWTSP